MENRVHKLSYLRIADAMRLFGLTARALRFYEDQGLIRTQRDAAMSRLYDATARRRLAWIAPLRRLGVPLRDIQVVLDANEPERAAMAEQMVHARRAKLQAELDQIDDYLSTSRQSAQAPRAAGGATDGR